MAYLGDRREVCGAFYGRTDVGMANLSDRRDFCGTSYGRADAGMANLDDGQPTECFESLSRTGYEPLSVPDVMVSELLELAGSGYDGVGCYSVSDFTKWWAKWRPSLPTATRVLSVPVALRFPRPIPCSGGSGGFTVGEKTGFGAPQSFPKEKALIWTFSC